MGIVQKALDRRDFRRMHGILSAHGWAHNESTSRYKHSTAPGTIVLHAHAHGGAAWHHTGLESNRGVKTLIDHLQQLHGFRGKTEGAGVPRRRPFPETTASASIGTSSSTGDPEWDDEKDDAPKPAGGTGTGGDTVSTGDPEDTEEALRESMEEMHTVMQRQYFSHVGTSKHPEKTMAHYARIQPRDGSVESVRITLKPGGIEQWEHRHYGVIKKGSEVETLHKFLQGTTRQS